MFLGILLTVSVVFAGMYTVIFENLPNNASLSTMDRIRKERMEKIKPLFTDKDKIDSETVTGFIAHLTEETRKSLSSLPNTNVINTTTQLYTSNNLLNERVLNKNKCQEAAQSINSKGYSTQNARRQQLVYSNEIREKLYPKVEWKKFDKRIMYLQVDAPWGLKYACDPNNPPNGYMFTNDGGTNVIVYVIDSGVDVEHEEFEGRAHWGADFTGKKVRYAYPRRNSYGEWSYDYSNLVEGVSYNTEPFMDEDGHGTAVASIIAGKKSGIAKNAAIIAVRVFDKDGKPPENAVIKGVNYVWRDYERRLQEFYEQLPEGADMKPDDYTREKLAEIIKMDGAPQAVVNMSLGTSGEDHAAELLIESAADHAGIHFSIAAGNYGLNAAGFTPARSYTGVGVGAYGQSLVKASFSNYGLEHHVELYAPGEGMEGAKTGTHDGMGAFNGTSFAAPVVAGIMALYLTHEKLTPSELRKRLLQDSEKNPNGVMTYELERSYRQQLMYEPQRKYYYSKWISYPHWMMKRFPMNMSSLKTWLRKRFRELGIRPRI